jgi:hypothetical protein
MGLVGGVGLGLVDVVDVERLSTRASAKADPRLAMTGIDTVSWMP